MPRKGRRRPDSFTLIVVPHTEKPSFSVRVPFWAIFVSVGLVLVGLAGLVFFALDYQDAASQLAELRRGGQMEIVRQADLLGMIVAERQQQDTLRSAIVEQSQRAVAQEVLRSEDAARFLEDAARFNEEVGMLYAQIAELEQFKADIRRIVGLDTQASAPSTQPAPAAASTLPSTATAMGPLEPLSLERLAASTSSRGGDRSATAADAINTTSVLIENTIPQQLADLEALRQEVTARIAKVDGQWASPDQLSRQLSVYDASPRAWPVFGNISARFGYDSRRLELGAQPFHKGIDITGPVGTPVKAPQDGVVTSVGWNGSFGLMLEIRHSLGWSTLYAHLSSAPVKVGETVKKGQTIGYIGMTGITTGPHLHYEIHLNGTPLDPAKYLGK